MKKNVLEPPEPKGKLDAETVNGPEDETLDWDTIVWPVHEENVRRLRQRIFKATKEQDLATVRNLQRMMLRSWSNTLISVRQVTQRNAGRGTPGVDGQVALTARARMDLAVQVHRAARSFQPLPVRRVYIPKANGKQRPLGIPAIADRAHQARCRNALEPEWEARFAPRTYGFRPGRSCQDAIAVIHVMGCGKNPRRRWILDADLTAAFDKIGHDHLLAKLGSFPGKGMIRGWLKAGVFEKGKGFAPTDEGTPQGGLCEAEHKPPCGVPVSDSSRSPSSVRIPVFRNAFTRPQTRLSLILTRSRAINAVCEISSKQALMSASRIQ